jgi:hypothetical protein
MCNLLQPPATSSLLGPDILLSALFSNNLNLCSSLRVSGKISHPHKTTGKIMVLYIFVFKFLERRWQDKHCELNGKKHSLNLICS